MLILNEAHARHLLATYQQQYNNHRPHQARSQLPPNPRPNTEQQSAPGPPPTRPQTAADPPLRRPDQQIPIHRLNSSDDFPSGTGCAARVGPPERARSPCRTHGRHVGVQLPRGHLSPQGDAEMDGDGRCCRMSGAGEGSAAPAQAPPAARSSTRSCTRLGRDAVAATARGSAAWAWRAWSPVRLRDGQGERPVLEFSHLSSHLNRYLISGTR
ncbi:hypothetical protein [Pseudonocardia sp.]|uniref:hypothetical protein n=1 Tax=Pseudonocardia sp. TaxID=60912 RepID=UPI0039C93D7F